MSRRGAGRAMLWALSALAVAVWLVAAVAGVWAAQRWKDAERARRECEQFCREAARLSEMRVRGQGVSVVRMSRTEASSWTYWETVARRSGIPADSFTIEPVLTEPQGEGPALLRTTVRLKGVTRKGMLDFLQFMRAERPFVGISAVSATRAEGDAWDVEVQAFLHFQEPQAGGQ